MLYSIWHSKEWKTNLMPPHKTREKAERQDPHVLGKDEEQYKNIIKLKSDQEDHEG